ncbi:uncharacterized protein MKK02DRAFT_39619 [Dioszegia hungarica]|uniref:Uncharacterized protein n=1 Tax=Dioszegia hungarica TaxID=4972 RepID=A0AA38HFC6_9TREE|nr:uncharacterized protein MKK02DRAFT_39619 [Dioszegia hungarica]KAI9639321.1 hypothetical protein MKK02DRAFT_39619 [Dioszegia hungarica]
MSAPISLLTAALFLLARAPTSTAHMAVWHPSVYGFTQPYQPVTPLSGQPFSKWWFHGNANDKPSEVMTITAGQPLTVEISCRKEHSSYGDQTSTDACPVDSGAYHAGGTTNSKTGWTGNSEAQLMGCALAIAPTANAASTKPEDFTIMSVLENCVRQRDTTFDIPANLPSCPGGECTCAWFWQGRNSQDEMYMVGFRCKVEGGVAVPFPKPAPPRRGKISGPTQPVYWANDKSNLDYVPDYESRPSYNSKFGWTDGAQTSAFGEGGGAAPAGNSTSQPEAEGGDGDGDQGEGAEGDTEDEEKEEEATNTSTRRGRPTGGYGGNKGGQRPSPVPEGGDGEGLGDTQNLAAVSGGDKTAVAPQETGYMGGGGKAGCKKHKETKRKRRSRTF